MLTEDTIEIPLTQGQVAIIDREDWEKVKGYNWCARYDKKMRGYYASTTISVNGRRRTIQLHRIIENAPKGIFVDHVNHNTLDNRKSNLRLCNHSQNQCNRIKPNNNTSGFKGVYKFGTKWMAIITYNKERRYLGLFITPEDAHAAYCQAALKLHGEFANFGYVSTPKIDNKQDIRTDSEIAWDLRKRKDNTSGTTGVCKHKNLWMAQISFRRTHYYLGLFDTPEQASAAYQQAAALRRELGPNGSPAEFRAAVDRLRGRAQTDRDSATLLLAQHF